MVRVILTLDYEIHGNGEGDPYALMVEPAERLLALFERYGAKLTIMAEVAEILKFRQYSQEHGADKHHYGAIVAQLQAAVERGHDVQLHLHSSYFKARYEQGRWQQDWSEYDLARLPSSRLAEMVALGKGFLESLLRPVDPDYRCRVFRAANWSVSPSRNVVRALVENGITIDTSVFKHGRRSGAVSFDYSHAFSHVLPWRVDADDICKADENGRLFEFPIYCENRWVGAFLTLQRCYRACLSRRHRLPGRGPVSPVTPGQAPAGPRQLPRLRLLCRRHAWKADFNQCGARQLIQALRRARAAAAGTTLDIPFVLIGHSKLFTRFNEWSLRPFLAFVARGRGQFEFGTFRDFAAAGGGALSGAGRALPMTEMAALAAAGPGPLPQ